MKIKTNKYGFYKPPLFFFSGRSKEFYKLVKEKYPIQYFLREIVWWNIYAFFKYDLRDWWHRLLCKYIYKYHIIKLSNDYHFIDSDYRIEKALEIILLDFIEKEEPWEQILWQRDDEKEAKSALVDAHYFFRVSKKQKVERIDQIMEELYGDDFDLDDFNKKDAIREPKSLELHRLENELTEETTKHLMNIVKYRKYMWT